MIFYENWQNTTSVISSAHAASWNLIAFFASVSWGQWFPGSNLISAGALDLLW